MIGRLFRMGHGIEFTSPEKRSYQLAYCLSANWHNSELTRRVSANSCDAPRSFKDVCDATVTLLGGVCRAECIPQSMSEKQKILLFLVGMTSNSRSPKSLSKATIERMLTRFTTYKPWPWNLQLGPMRLENNQTTYFIEKQKLGIAHECRSDIKFSDASKDRRHAYLLKLSLPFFCGVLSKICTQYP